jgi:hypothetical protein
MESVRAHFSAKQQLQEDKRRQLQFRLQPRAKDALQCVLQTELVARASEYAVRAASECTVGHAPTNFDEIIAELQTSSSVRGHARLSEAFLALCAFVADCYCIHHDGGQQQLLWHAAALNNLERYKQRQADAAPPAPAPTPAPAPAPALSKAWWNNSAIPPSSAGGRGIAARWTQQQHARQQERQLQAAKQAKDLPPPRKQAGVNAAFQSLLGEYVTRGRGCDDTDTDGEWEKVQRQTPVAHKKWHWQVSVTQAQMKVMSSESHNEVAEVWHDVHKGDNNNRTVLDPHERQQLELLFEAGVCVEGSMVITQHGCGVPKLLKHFTNDDMMAVRPKVERATLEHIRRAAQM